MSKGAKYERKTYKVAVEQGNNWLGPMREEGWLRLSLETKGWAPGPLKLHQRSGWCQEMATSLRIRHLAINLNMWQAFRLPNTEKEFFFGGGAGGVSEKALGEPE